MKALLMTALMLGFMCSLLSVAHLKSVYGGEMTEEMKQMQKQLNNEVMSKPFSVADEAQVKSYIEDTQRKGIVPPPYTGRYWQPGYTCYNLRPYSYQEYLACRYYHFYYGYYYR